MSLGTELFSMTTRGENDNSPIRMYSGDYIAMLEKRNRLLKELMRALVRPEGQYDGIRPQA